MEPQINSDEWMNNYAYRYEKVDELLAYLNTFENFEERINKYRSLCERLGGNYSLYGASQYFEREVHRDSEGDYVDEGSDKIPFKLFGLFPKTRDDKRILNRYAFDERREDLYSETIRYPETTNKVIPYSDLVKNFNERLSKTPIKIDFIKGEYDKINSTINNLSGNQKIASEIAYNDLMLIEPIDWSDFSVIKVSGLGVALTCIWDLVEYQIFLKQAISNLNKPLQVTSNGSKVGAVPEGWHFEPLFHLKRLVRYFYSRLSKGQQIVLKQDIALDCFSDFNGHEIERIIYTAEHGGYIVYLLEEKYQLDTEKAKLVTDEAVDLREVDLTNVPIYVNNAYNKIEIYLESIRYEYEKSLLYYSDSEKRVKLVQNRDVALKFYRQNKVISFVEDGPGRVIKEVTIAMPKMGSYFINSPNCTFYNDEGFTPEKKLEDIISSEVKRWFTVVLLNKMIDELDFKKTDKSSKLVNSNTGPTLLCNLIEPQITTLFNNLSAGRYIDSGVRLAEFSGALLGSDPMAKPLQWLKSNRALAYLFKEMYGIEMINNREWQSVIQKRALFRNKKGKLIVAQDLAQAITDYQSEGNPTEAGNIDVILMEVKALKD